MRGAERRVHDLLVSLAVLLCILLFLLPPPCRAASPDLFYMPDETDGVSALKLNRQGGWMEVLFRAGQDEADNYKIRETLLSPRVNLAIDGSVYHERFLAFNLDGTLSLERYRARGDVRLSKDVSFADYNASATFLRHHGANLNLFARRNNAWVDDHFQSSYRVRSSTVGAELHAKSSFLPVALAYDHVKRIEDFVGKDRVEKQDNARFSTFHRVSFSQTDVSLRYLGLNRNIQHQDYETVSAGLTNMLRVSPESKFQLRTYARYFNQYGSIRRRALALSEEAAMNWTEDLQSSLRYQFSEQTGSSAAGRGGRPDLTRSQRGEVSAQHTLYGSLTASGSTTAPGRLIGRSGRSNVEACALISPIGGGRSSGDYVSGSGTRQPGKIRRRRTGSEESRTKSM
jgi:hypothetical protein